MCGGGGGLAYINVFCIIVTYILHSREYFCLAGHNENTKRYILIRQSVIWRDAQKYCREHHTDLASVRNQTENHVINETAEGQTVWMGLFRDDWKWSDQSGSLFRFWSLGLPDNSEKNENCAATKPHKEMNWGDRRCDYKYPFICYESELVFICSN